MRTFLVEYGQRYYASRRTRVVEAENMMAALLAVSNSHPDETLVYYRSEMLSEHPTLRWG